MPQIILIRHGQSEWNLQNKFTGWTDVRISEQGRKEASQAGKKLLEAGFVFDFAYTSMLTRAIQTLHIALDEMHLLWIPIIKAWQLNERHYGDLQGLDKQETIQKYGEEQVKLWRRSYDIRPPLLQPSDPRSSANDPRYKDLLPKQIPLAENLQDTVRRVVPYWEKEILPKVISGKKIILVAHGNSLRALIKHIENLSSEEILEVEVPTGKPLIYEIGSDSKFLGKKYL
jgi:2,3-bisphosphoglycerate-dependent phosphoglycerate mutase